MRLGAAYNVFDGEELLEASVRSIRASVQYVVIVYQTESNFGNKCSPGLEPLLVRLKEEKLVDEIVHYTPRESFTRAEKKALISPRAGGHELQGALPHEIADQFFNELQKRELGRQKCADARCSHFMTMDADEFYRSTELEKAKAVMVDKGYDGCACKMRIFFKYPECELMPKDDMNHVSLIYKIDETMTFRLACPYPCVLDPTRRVHNVIRFHIFERDEIEMYHYSFVRDSIMTKLTNVSNRTNYTEQHNFASKFESWAPGDPIIHPHVIMKEHFKFIRIIPNIFNIQIEAVHFDRPTLLGTASPTSDSSDDYDADSCKQHGNKAFSQYLFEEAETWYTIAIQQNGDEAVYFNNRAAVYLKMEQFHKGLSDAEKAITLRPKWSKAHFRKGEALLGMLKLQEALSAFHSAQKCENNKAVAQKIDEIELLLDKISLGEVEDPDEIEGK